MTNMQKRFLHERLSNPDPTDHAYGAFQIFKVFCEGHFLFRKSPEINDVQAIPVDAFPVKYLQMALDRAKIAMSAYSLEHMYNDHSLQALGLMAKWFMHGNPRSLVFAKEFWPALKKTKLQHISWNMLPKTFAGTFRFPDPIIDNDGDPISEVMMTIQPREDVERLRRKPYQDHDGQGSRVLIMWWVCGDHGGSTGFNVQLIPDGDAPIIPETWTKSLTIKHHPLDKGNEYIPLAGNSEHVQSMVKALFYVCSGDPDIRSDRNKIIFKPGTASPIAVHREFSRAKYELVGWNWMKKLQERRYTKDGWMVEPFARYQPYGPRDNPSYRWIIVEGHERHRRIKTEEDEVQQGVPQGVFYAHPLA
jgi:hypothetical protein